LASSKLSAELGKLHAKSVHKRTLHPMPLGNAHLQLMQASRKKELEKQNSLKKKSFLTTGGYPDVSSPVKARSRFGSEDSSVSTTGSTMTSLSRTHSRSRLYTEESICSSHEELREQLEELQIDYEEKCNELVECENELKTARMELNELQILLKSQIGDRRSSVIPYTMEAGSFHEAGNPQAEELRRMFLWLAEQAILEEPIRFNANCDLIMAGQHVRIRNIVQWRLRTTDLRLSVPEEMAREVEGLLAATKMDPKTVCEAKAKAIIDSWLLTTSEAMSATTSAVTLLTHRVSQVSCVVANFPVPPIPPVSHMQEFAGFRLGDIVEVNFEGEWFRGVIRLIDGDGVASVQCDVDPPDVLTKTPMSFLRRAFDPARDAVAPQPTPAADASAAPEAPQPQPQPQGSVAEEGEPDQVETKKQSPPQSPAQEKRSFTHARTFSGPVQQ
jgi:hypothetical protein